jgi:hypothetical protein
VTIGQAEAQKAYNALCSAEAHLDGIALGQYVRGRLAEIRKALGDDPSIWSQRGQEPEVTDGNG